MRDEHKYDWLPPDPPRQPRQQLSVPVVAITLIVALALTGAVALGAIAFVGWWKGIWS